MMLTNEPIVVANTRQRLVDTPCGRYQLMASWPFGAADHADLENVPIIFLVDGNAYFHTATDIVRRVHTIHKKSAVVVGVGYPLTEAIYDMTRRSHDLTPPSRKGPAKPFTDIDTALVFGGADAFLAALVDVLLPAVEHDLLPDFPVAIMRKMLFGHSYGGLFTLYALFSRPDVFTAYIAASPSVWFNDCSIVQEQEADYLQGPPPRTRPRLCLTAGTGEETAFHKPGETPDEYTKRKAQQAKLRMVTNATALAARLRTSGRLHDVSLHLFEQEDHGDAAVVGLQRGLNVVLNEWWEEKEGKA